MNQELYEKYVHQIARSGSLTKAAGAMGVTQPALSSALAALERSLGFRIFDRRQAPLAPTEEGELYLDYLRRKRAMESDLEKRLEARRGERDRRVSIGAPAIYAQSLVARAVSRLLRSHPDYEAAVRTAPLDALIELSADGELDCFVCTGETLPEDFTMAEIRRERLCLCVPKDEALNAELSRCPGGVLSREALSLLKGAPFVLMERSQPIRERMDALFAEAGVTLRVRATVDQVSAAVSLAAQGAGCCFAPIEALSDFPGREALRIYTFPEEDVGRHIYAAWHSGFYMPEACRELIGFLAEDH